MEDSQQIRDDKLVFAVNGDRFELSDVHPSTTLLQFLRSQTRFKSVKLGCGEGGCGACVVLLSKYDPVLKQVENNKVSSCLTLVCSLNKCSITTTEGLGNSKDGFHPIHQRMAGFHASQCGFCTPGMCVSLFSALVNSKNSTLTASEAQNSIAGNLCRCTGYRPIADVCKSFASDVDMEDLGINSFWKKGDNREDKVTKLPFYDPTDEICMYPEFLKNECNSVNFTRKSWLSPYSIDELQMVFKSNLTSNGTKLKLVVGNTSTGYYKEEEKYEKYVDLRYIPELFVIKSDSLKIEIGATVTISKAIVALREENELMFNKLGNHMEKIASDYIRNSASIGGNLVIAQRDNFPSDLATIFLAVESTVTISSGQKCETINLEEFFARPPIDSRTLLLSVQIPYRKPITANKFLFETYRASPRPLGNALSYLNAAFLANVSYIDGVKINEISLAFGGYGTKHAIRAKKVEEYLCGKILSVGVLYEAVKLVRATMLSQHGTADPTYVSSLAAGYVFEFLSPLIKQCNNDVLVQNGDEINKYGDFDCNMKEDSVLSAKQVVVESSREYFPVGQPITKTSAASQASGEAIYVDDIPSPENCVYGAFVNSTKPLARVKNIKLESKESQVADGIICLISFKDIPKGGENVGSKTMFGTEPLFADDITVCAGQPLAFVVADTQMHADRAAATAIVDYDTQGLEPPILTVEDAVERSSFYDVPSFLYPEQVGDFSKGMAEADHTIPSAEIKLESQYYFYMETQTALAVPDEDNCMVVYSSAQSPEFTHSVIAKCLGVQEHNVRVITRRVGGGFGGKAIRSMPIATAAALAAHKLRRPVRVYLNRKTDMIMAGGRHPMKIRYTAGFKSDGKITAVHLDILINAGISADISPVMPHNMSGPLRKYDWGALSFDFKVCKTNHTSKSAMRGPGEVQASYIAEAIIENVASALSMEADSVRMRNLHTFESLGKFYKSSAGELLQYTLPSIMHRIAINSSFENRVESIKEYNSRNQWRKKGISRVPIIYEVTLRPTPGKVSILWDGSIVVEVGGIELGQGLWTKVKQVTAFGLGSVFGPGSEPESDGLLDKVRVVQTDTLSLVQGGFTAGSTTSESSCEAVRICCNVLVERLTPLKEKLIEQTGSVTWETLILQAHYQSVNLSASTYFVPEFSSMKYLNYGAAVSEVEVNVLTGETKILRSDIIYDCGQSMNPAVDFGQIEGAFVQGLGFFMSEEYTTNSDGLVIGDGTWNYKIPTIDTIPKQFNVEILKSGHHQKRILSSKASGEPPLLLAVSVHCAARAAIKAARKQVVSWGLIEKISEDSVDSFQLEVPATMPVVKQLCGLDNVEKYLQSLILKQ